MTKVITFSRTFPSYHPKAGHPTNFKYKILRSLGIDLMIDPETNGSISLENFEPKHHTIRAGRRWNVGDKFSPRMWSGAPYKSKQIIIAPDIEVKKVWTFDIDRGLFCINGIGTYLKCDGKESIEMQVAKNDGLELGDLLNWFKYPKEIINHQIICWNENVFYS